MRRLILIALALALALPAAASASPSGPALRAQERYYSSYDAPAPLPAAEPDGPWRTIAAGAGALVLLLGAAEAVTLARLRRATWPSEDIVRR